MTEQDEPHWGTGPSLQELFANIPADWVAPPLPEIPSRYSYPPTWSRRERLEIVRDLAARDGQWTCSYCETLLDETTAQIDHVVPRSRGGSDDMRNLALACGPCNRRKGNQLVEELDWRR